MKNWFRFVVDHPYLVIALVVVTSIAFGWKLPELRFHTSIYDLTVEDLPETIRYQDFKEEFGSEELILVVISAENVFNAATFRRIGLLSDELARIEGVNRIISLPVIKREMDVTDKWSLPDFEKIIAPIDLFQKNLVSKDRSRTAISLILGDIKNRRSIVDSVEQIIADEKTFSLYQIGVPVVFEALAKYTQKDFFTLPPITFLMIGIVLFFLFRNIRGIFLPTCCVLICLVWTFGLMAWMSIPLSMLTMIVPVFLIAVGTAYCMHIVTEYMEALNRLKTSSSAVLQCFSNMRLPTSLAVFTTSAGLCSLLVNKVDAIRDFALFSCFGMLSCLALMFSLLPALMSILPVPGDGNDDVMTKGVRFDGFLNKIVQLNLNHQKLSLSLIAVLIAFSAWGIFYIKIETNPVEYFKSDTPVSRHFHDIYRDMSGSFPLNVVLDSKQDSYFEDPENIAKLSRIQGFINTLNGVDKTISFADYLKLVNYASNQNQQEYYSLPEEPFEVRILINKFKGMLGEDMLRQVMNEDFSKANMLLRTHISSSRDILMTKEKILKHLKQNYSRDFNVEITGVGVLISESSNRLTKSQIKSLSLTLAFVFVIMLLLFLSSKVSFIAIVPNCFPIIINFGLMGWLGIELSMVTCLIASIAIGLAVDDTIHYLVNYSREIKKDLNKNRALHATVRHIGKSIVFTTLAISIGFFILAFSHFKPTAIFGLMLVITMFSALIGDLIILPSLMLHVELVTAWDVLKQMKPLGGVSADIAHELNQPLNAIKMGSEFLKMMVEHQGKIPEEHLSQVVNEISMQVDRASETIKRLSDFDQKVDLRKTEEKIHINDPINNVVAILGHQFALENISLDLELDETISPIYARTNHLEQMVYNLLINAREAIAQKQNAGVILDHHMIKVQSFNEGKKVGFGISDTGIGVPKNMRERIFEPFFTCDEKGGGMGLGLSITYGLVKEYGGKIRVESEEGEGSTFTVTFPSSE